MSLSIFRRAVRLPRNASETNQPIRELDLEVYYVAADILPCNCARTLTAQPLSMAMLPAPFLWL